MMLCLVLLFLSLQVTTGWTRQGSHALGVTVINGQPKRVVPLFQGATDTAVALGITPVGVVDSWIEKPTYRYLRSALGDVPHVVLETQPNLDRVFNMLIAV